jgi:putative glutamine amidotransferase
VSTLERVYAEAEPALHRRALRITGDPDVADDLCQEAFARAWRRLDPGVHPAVAGAWLHRTVANLALDERRRRSRRGEVPLDEAAPLGTAGTPDADGVAEALGRLTTHDRFVLLLRFDHGLALREIAALLDLGEDAARKRVARARDAFRAAYRACRGRDAPHVVLLVRDDDPAPYRRWLEHAGARVDLRPGGVGERDVLLADALVVTGSHTDISPALYGERPSDRLSGTPDLARDRRDLAAVDAALRAALPVLGVCSGHQLLNLASGGTLHQDLAPRGRRAVRHTVHRHRVETAAGTHARRLAGRSSEVRSGHHQGVRRLGRRLRVAGTAPDGLVEAIERTDRRFAVGVQWRPQDEPDAPASRRLAEAVVAAAARW